MKIFIAIFHCIINVLGYRLLIKKNKYSYTIDGSVQLKENCGPLRLIINIFGRYLFRIIKIRPLFIRKTSDVSWMDACRDINAINQKIDYSKILDLRQSTLSAHLNKGEKPNDVLGAWKFLDIDLWIPVNLERFYSLGLHTSPPLNILDISGGAGYFAFICKHFGHNVNTTDIDLWEEFNKMVQILNIERSVLWIKPKTKLPCFGKSFDLITSFMIAFNFPNDYNKKKWEEEQWHFFLKDLKNNQLKKNGKIYLLLNPDMDKTYYSEDLYHFFLRLGAKINGPEIYFEDTSKI